MKEKRITYSATEVANILAGHLIALGEVALPGKWNLTINLGREGAELICAAVPEEPALDEKPR